MLPTQTILQPVQIATGVPGTETQIENSILTLLSSSRGSMGESSLMVCFLDHIPDAQLPDALPTQTSRWLSAEFLMNETIHCDVCFE